MSTERKDQRGKWVFRNQRWYFVPGEAGRLDYEPRSIDSYALLSLVSVDDFVGTLRVGMSLFRLPLLVSLPSQGEEPQRPPVSSREFLKPPWWLQMEEEIPAVETTVRREMEAVALAAARGRAVVEGDSFLGPRTIVGLPVAFTHDRQQFLYGVLTALVVGAENLPAAEQLQRRLSVSAAQAREVHAGLAAVVRPDEVAQKYRGLLEIHVQTHGNRVRQAFEQRLELAAEQARARHYLVRAENLERQLLRGSGEIDRARDASGVMAQELMAILDNPHIGVTIEDTNHRIRYQNPLLRRTFGNMLGRRCYEAYKGRLSECTPCAIRQIWEEGRGSVRYTTQDPRSGRAFEVFSFPVVGEGGEKLIVEVGVEVTELVKKQERLADHVNALQARNRQLLDMVEELTAVLLDSAGEIGGLLIDSSLFAERAPEEDRFRDESTSERAQRIHDAYTDLLDRVQDVGHLALALAGAGEPVSVDVPSLVEQVRKELEEGEGIRLPDVRVAVMPDVLCPEAGLASTVAALVRRMVAEADDVPPPIDVSHTMSGAVDAIAAGDRFHVLSLGRRRPRVEFGDTEVTGSQEVSGISETLSGGLDLDLATASLLVRKMGGSLWRHLRREETDAYYFTLPMEPPV